MANMYNSESDEELVVIAGQMCLCRFCDVPCLATVDHQAICQRCMATPAAQRRYVKMIMELCKRCRNTYTYEDGPDVLPSAGWTLCFTCRLRKPHVHVQAGAAASQGEQVGDDEGACGCGVTGCYFCFGGSDH